jgi:UPF0755 protein
LKRFLALLLGLLIAGGVLFAGALGGFYILNTGGVSEEEPPVLFTIDKGESYASLAKRLEDVGIIRSELFFRLLGRRNGDASRVKAGTYEIRPGMDATDMLALFVRGQQKLVRVTIPEGLTITRIAAILADKGVTEETAFIRWARSETAADRYEVPGESLEGFLYPDTYFLPPEAEPVRVTDAMIDNFYKRLSTVYPDWEDLDENEFYRRVILASIVEREYRIAGEAPLIASVFYNRLGVNMGLGSCATVEYIITEIQGRPHPDYLTYRDLSIESDYNTYLWAGLPPGPISNPGTVALDAAFNPADTDYWYFLLKDPATGEHYFSEDSSEHNQAKRIYLKSR